MGKASLPLPVQLALEMCLCGRHHAAGGSARHSRSLSIGLAVALSLSLCSLALLSLALSVACLLACEASVAAPVTVRASLSGIACGSPPQALHPKQRASTFLGCAGTPESVDGRNPAPLVRSLRAPCNPEFNIAVLVLGTPVVWQRRHLVQDFGNGHPAAAGLRWCTILSQG